MKSLLFGPIRQVWEITKLLVNYAISRTWSAISSKSVNLEDTSWAYQETLEPLSMTQIGHLNRLIRKGWVYFGHAGLQWNIPDEHRLIDYCPEWGWPLSAKYWVMQFNQDTNDRVWLMGFLNMVWRFMSMFCVLITVKRDGNFFQSVQISLERASVLIPHFEDDSSACYSGPVLLLRCLGDWLDQL